MRSHQKLLLVPVLSVVAACGTVQETGRGQFTMFSDQEMSQLGAQAYQEAISGYREIKTGPQAEMVRRVGTKIAQASGRNYEWEFKLLDAPKEVNAFCLPGGKIAVFSGILPVTQNEDGLAIVVGHEVAHATSGHGNERMSQSGIAELVMSLGGAALGFTELSEGNRDMVMALAGATANVAVMLPFSRKHETEADRIGLLFALRAGYRIEEAPLLWERMAKMGGGGGPEFLSTHPDPLGRAEDLRRLIPEVKARGEDALKER